MKRALLTAAGLTAAALVVWLLTDDELTPLVPVLDPDLTECVACGALAIWVDGKPTNPGPDDEPAWCVALGDGTRRRLHGPFIPVINLT